MTRTQPCIVCSGQEETDLAQPGDSRELVKVWESKVLFSSLPWFSFECPLIALDISSRPDIEDLKRVLMLEGKGEGKARWRYERVADDWLCVLHVQVSCPVFASFDVPFALPVTRHLLEAIARARELYICFSPLPLDLEGESGIRVLTELLSDGINLEFEMPARKGLVDCLRLSAEHLRVVSMVSMKVAQLIKSSFKAL